MVFVLSVLAVKTVGALVEQCFLVLAVGGLVFGVKPLVSALDVFHFLGAQFMPFGQPLGVGLGRVPGCSWRFVLTAAFCGQLGALLLGGQLDKLPAENVFLEVHALGCTLRLDVEVFTFSPWGAGLCLAELAG
jgi:hypothetical protein